MELIQWNAYDYVGDYRDVSDWKASFFYDNELKTLIEDIERLILKGKRVTYDCECNDENVRLTISGGESFLFQIIGNMESNFIIRQIDECQFRIDQMPADNIEIVMFVKLAYTDQIH